MASWQLQEAKQRFSEVVKRTADEPQVVTRHGEEVAVILSFDDYQQLRAPVKDFRQHLLGPPYAEVELPIERSATPAPVVDLP
jgi:antitoxin Phd